MSGNSLYDSINNNFSRVVEINEAIAESVFSYEFAGLPVYLDLDGDALDEIAQRLQKAPADVPQTVIDAVKAVIIDTPTKTNQFSRFRRANADWHRGDTSTPPPALALLAVFSIAAERMQQSQKMAANNYYGRLDEILGLGGKDNAEKSYREVCDDLWQSLVTWLENWEGERGLPSVPADSEEDTQPYKYVNKAISQALLRDVDRNALPKIFASAGLEPQQEIDAEDIAGFLDEGIPTYGTNNLQRLWKKRDLREVIAQAAVGSLRTWTGSMSTDRPTEVGVRLVAIVQKVFGQRLDLNIDIPHPDYRSNRVLSLTTTDQSLEDLQFFPSGNRSLRLIDANLLDTNTLIDGQLRLIDPLTDIVASRLPRGVVPLRHDEITQSFIEADRVVLGVPHVILARRTAISSLATFSLSAQVDEVLSECARPGWSVDESIEGLPEGWVLFNNVEMLSVPNLASRNFALRVLEPMSVTSTVLTGGVLIPGAIRKWSSLRPPMVTVLNDVDSGVGLLKIFGHRDDRLIESFPISGAAEVVDLAPLELPDGNYRLELTIDDVTRSGKLWLRSSMSPSTKPLNSLAYPLGGSPLGMLSAENTGDAGSENVTGVIATAELPEHDSTAIPLPEEPWWAGVAAIRTHATTPDVRIEITPPDPNSCAVTGAHHFALPVWMGRATTEFISGVCKGCGIVNKYPARPKYNWKEKSNSGKSTATRLSAPKLDLKKISAIEAAEEPDWDVILDVLCHLGSGSIGDLDRLATQVEGTLLATDRLVRGLEILGHIDVHLSPTTMRPARWSCTPASIALCNDHHAILVGRRNPKLVERIAEIVNERGARLERLVNRNLPATIRVVSDSPISVSMFEGLEDPITGIAVTVVSNPSLQIAARLSSISSMTEALPRVPLPAHRKVELWDSKSTKWVEAEDAEKPGAYRFSGYEVVYGFRREIDVAEKKIRLCTVQLLKHVVAQNESSTLLAYRPDVPALITRLGADLPGLYGRAAVLCSGLAPIEDTEQRALIYPDVSPEVAALIGKAVTS